MDRLPMILLLCTSLAMNGCTLIGTGIGASTPHYEDMDWKHDAIELGALVRVRVRTVGADAVEFAALTGRYGGIRDGLLSITDDDGREHEIAVADIVDVDVRRGTEWKRGLVLGAAADAIVATAVVAIASGANVSISTGR